MKTLLIIILLQLKVKKNIIFSRKYGMLWLILRILPIFFLSVQI